MCLTVKMYSRNFKKKIICFFNILFFFMASALRILFAKNFKDYKHETRRNESPGIPMFLLVQLLIMSQCLYATCRLV